MDRFRSSFPNHNYDVQSSRSRHETEPSNVDIARHNNPGRLCLPGRPHQKVNENVRTYQWKISDNALVYPIPYVMKEQGVLAGHDQYSGSGVYLQDQPWSANNNCGMDSAVSYCVPSPSIVHVTSNYMSVPHLKTDEHMSNQLSSTQPNPGSFQPDPVMMQDMPLPDLSVHPLRHAGNTAFTEQEQCQDSNTVVSIIKAKDDTARIGSVLSNGRLMCDAEGCGGQTFARQAELRRHHTTLHAPNKPNFWCPVPTCRRSVNGGSEAFHRKDKMIDHVRAMHSGV